MTSRSLIAKISQISQIPKTPTSNPYSLKSKLPRLQSSPSSSPKPTLTRPFSSSSAVMVKAGDSIPKVDLLEDSPGNTVSLAEELSQGKGVIIGVPAAFSPSCSAKHIPGYINHPKLKDAGKVFVVSVNDPFVMKAWGESLDATKSSKIRFLGDISGEFNNALDTRFDSAKIFGQDRSKRYAVTVEDGKVKEAFVEPDNTGVNVSAAENVLG